MEIFFKKKVINHFNSFSIFRKIFTKMDDSYINQTLIIIVGTRIPNLI